MQDVNFFVAKSSPNFYCEKCDYKCNRKNDFGKHCNTKKHKMLINANNCHKSDPEHLPQHFSCVCGKSYLQKTNLYRHRKACSMVDKKSNVNEIESVKLLITDLKEIILEQNSKILKLTSILNANTNANPLNF
jgi:hypothetical protein